LIGHKVDSKNFSHNHYRDKENFKLKPLSNKGLLNFSGYVIDNCSSRMLNFSGTTEKHPEV